jgi:hypothetical protein
MTSQFYAALMAGPVAGVEQQGGIALAILMLLIAGTAAFVLIRNLFRGP